MEDDKKFGARLKELRIRAGMTQRGLAKSVNVDFTYLSKIENGVMPPPSEKVILQLAEVLKADRDELITLAGKIPSDIAEQEHDIDLIELVDQTKRRTKPASEKHIAIIKKNTDIDTIQKKFGKNPVLLTDGEANLAIKACFGEIDWDDVEKILSEVN